MTDGIIYDKIYRFLLAHNDTSHSIKNIYKHVGCDKRTANKCLYDMLKQEIVLKTKEKQPPCWQYRNPNDKMNVFKKNC